MVYRVSLCSDLSARRRGGKPAALRAFGRTYGDAVGVLLADALGFCPPLLERTILVLASLLVLSMAVRRPGILLLQRVLAIRLSHQRTPEA